MRKWRPRTEQWLLCISWPLLYSPLPGLACGIHHWIFPVGPNRKHVCLGPALSEPGYLPTPGFGLNPKSGLEKQRSGIHLHGWLFIHHANYPVYKLNGPWQRTLQLTPACPPHSLRVSWHLLEMEGAVWGRGGDCGNQVLFKTNFEKSSKSFLGICSSENPRRSQGR